MLLVVAAYGGSLTADFVNWDDPIHVYESRRVIARDGLLRSWTDGSEPGRYPVLFATYWVEWRAARHAAWLFHLDSILVHAGNALLVGALAGALGMAPAACWLVGALWGLHPVHVESVAWISERKNVLYLFFWLGSLLLFLRSERAGAYAASLALFVLALLCKGAAMTLPAGILLTQWMRGGRLDRRFCVALAPYVALGVAGGMGLLGLVPSALQPPPLGTRIAVAARAFWCYLETFLWPHPLVPVYPKWSIAALGPTELVSIAALVLLVSIGVAIRDRLPRLVLFGVGVFATNIVLVLGLVWNSYDRFAFLADRYLYLPAVGLAIATVAAAYAIAHAAGLPARVPAAVLAVWIAALGVATWWQVPVWHDSEALWAHTLRYNPDCAACHLNMGNFLADHDDLDGAVAHYERALAIEADYKLLLAFGKARARQDRLEDAVALYQRALRLEPDHAETHYALANALRRQGKSDEAIARYRRALELEPDSADFHNNFGVALLGAGRIDEAGAEFERTLALSPGDVEAELNLALVAEGREDWPAAIAHYHAALPRAGNDPKFGAAHRRFADALLHEGRAEDAIVEYEAAHRLLPADEDVLDDLVGALLAQGRVREAVQALDEALARAPDSAHLASSLAWIRATSADEQWRDGAEAVRLAERARDLTNDRDADALDTLAAAYAAAGRFEDAVRTGRRALEVAEAGSDLADDIRSRLELYATGQPYRMPAPEAGAAPAGR